MKEAMNMAPKRNMVTNIQGLRWASLLVKNQMASRRVRPTWDSTWLSMKNTSRKAMVELPKPLLKISPGDMIWKMARIAMHSRLVFFMLSHVLSQVGQHVAEQDVYKRQGWASRCR